MVALGCLPFARENVEISVGNQNDHKLFGQNSEIHDCLQR